MGKIVAIAGTHGTGKTTAAYTLCAYAKRNGVSSVVLDERARECPFKINEESTDLTQTWLILAHAKKELELCEKYDIVISDRSVIDSYVYGTVLGIEGNFRYLLEYCVEHINSNYLATYLLDKDKFNFCVDDGVRSVNADFRNSVYENFLTILDDNEVQYIKIHSEAELLGSFRKLVSMLKSLNMF